MESREAGFLIGAGVGASVSLLRATGQTLVNIRQQQRNAWTVNQWAAAVDFQKQRAVRAERQNARLVMEVNALRQALADAQFELGILRNA